MVLKSGNWMVDFEEQEQDRQAVQKDFLWCGCYKKCRCDENEEEL